MGVVTGPRARLKPRSAPTGEREPVKRSEQLDLRTQMAKQGPVVLLSGVEALQQSIPAPKPENPSSATGRGVLIGLLSAFGSAALVALIFAIIYFFKYSARGRILLDRLGRPGEFDDEQARAREEAEALETMDEISRAEYLRAKAFIEANPPDSVSTDISLSQFLAIQEKGVSAWEFEPELEIANCFVEARTEIEFFDSECSVQTNLPVPKQNEVYYWEAKLYEKPESSLISIGMSTKPYPLFRLPGWHKCSIGYTSTGHRRYSQAFSASPYGPPLSQGDVVGCGYRPRSGTVFFTRNGKKLDDVAHGLKSVNLFPTVGANGPCSVHVNFGQLGFVFIEANVKKWGLAPMTGSLAPPPPYGSEQGSILLETGRAGQGQPGYFDCSPAEAARHGRGRASSTIQNRNGSGGAVPPTSPGPARSPTDISLTSIVHQPPNTNTVQFQREMSPPPDYASQTSTSSDSGSEDGDNDDRRRREREQERERLLRSPTPAYDDITRERSPGGRWRSGSAPAGPSGTGRRP